MKWVVFHFSLILLLCIFWGIVISLVYHDSSWWILLVFYILISVSAGWVILSDIPLKVNRDNLKKTMILVDSGVLLMLVLSVFAAFYPIDLFSFWGMVYVVSVILYILFLSLAGVSLQTRYGKK